MSKKNMKELGSLKLTKKLIETSNKKKINSEINYHPRWVLGRDTLYNPKK